MEHVVVQKQGSLLGTLGVFALGALVGAAGLAFISHQHMHSDDDKFDRLCGGSAGAGADDDAPKSAGEGGEVVDTLGADDNAIEPK